LGALAATDRSCRLRDVREHPEFTGFPAHHPPMMSLMSAPIRYRGHVGGFVYVANKQDVQEFSGDDQSALELFAERVGALFEVARTRELEARERAKLAVLARSGVALAEPIELEGTLDVVTRLFVPAFAEACAIDLLDEAGALETVTLHDPHDE